MLIGKVLHKEEYSLICLHGIIEFTIFATFQRQRNVHILVIKLFLCPFIKI